MVRFGKRTLLASAVSAAVLAAVTLSPAGSAVRQRFSVVQTGSGASNAFVFINTNSGGGAVSGQVAPSQYTVTAQAGLFGVFDPSTSAYGDGVLGLSYTGNGVVGQALSGNYSGVFGEAQGSATGPGVEGVGTTATAVGVLGASNYTTAMLGETGSTASGTAAGVEGQDVAADNGVNAGVLGTTTNGGYGIQGTSTDGALGGAEGIGTNGDGVDGFSGSSEGVYGQSTSGIGVFGVNDASGTINSTIKGETGLYGSSNIGNGVYAYSANRNGAAIENDSSSYYTLYVQYDNSDTGGSVFSAYNNNSGTSLATLDASGNLSLHGKLFDTDGTFARTRNPNSDRTLYSAKQAESTVEDFGTAHLVNGQAAVPLTADFKETIDTASSYMVFTTPHGDSRGLYVASTSAAGFVVRESQGGRSNLMFDYRIVAKPYGAREERLPHFTQLVPKPRSQGEPTRPGIVRSEKFVKSLQHRTYAKVHMPSVPPAFHYTTR